jgi:hypothetical protein
MTPERMAWLVARWVRLYTRNVPAPVAGRRRDEIDSDVHDHIAHERALGTAERRIAVSIAGRMGRGLPADLAWRWRMRTSARRSTIWILLATALILLVPLVAMPFTDEVDWGVADFVAAGVLICGTGLLLERAARRTSNTVHLAVAIAIAVVAIVLGEADDAPGLILFGLLIILGTVALAVRKRLRSE